MATTIQIKRGTTAKNNSYTGALGELTLDTGTQTVRIHDGSTRGGHSLTLVYASCSTAAGTVAKTVTGDGFRLIKGSLIIVDFVNGNTATNPTLNVSGTGAKALKSMGANLGELAAHTCLMFVYTGAEFVTVGVTLNNPTVFGTLSIE